MALTASQIKNYKFPHSSQMDRLLKFCVNSQGAFSQDAFRQAGGTATTERYWLKAGLMERNKNTNEKGFVLTKKFSREYNKQRDPNKTCSRSGVNAPKHSEAIAKTLLAIPRDVPAHNILNETEVKQQAFSKPSEATITQRENAIIDKINTDCQRIHQEYRNATEDEKTKLYYDVQRIDKLQESVNSGNIYRSPDMMASFSPAQLQTFHDNMETWYNSRNFQDGRSKELAYEGLHKMERLIAQSVITHQTEITISMEVITSNYDQAELVLHQHFEDVMGIEQIYIPA